MSVHCDQAILRRKTSCHPWICTVKVSPHNTGHQDCSVEEYWPSFEVCVTVKFAGVVDWIAFASFFKPYVGIKDVSNRRFISLPKTR